MVKTLFLLSILILTPQLAYSAAPKYRDVIRCQISEGYELAVQKKGKAYYLSLIYGDRTEYRERLKKPKRMIMAKTRNHFEFELKNPNSEDYLVKMTAQFDEDAASYDEFIHYKLQPNPKKVASYKLYEMAGNGLPVQNLGCTRP